MGKLVVGVNDLKSFCDKKMAWLLDEWDYEKNTVQPDEIAVMSNKKRWWICRKGHSFECDPNSRVSRKRGCPYCANQKILQGYNDLLSIHPKIVEEWDFEKNANILPNEVGATSTKTVWWKCEKEHLYEMRIDHRTRDGLGCPYCSGHRVWKGFNDLATTNIELLAEWDYEKNEFTPTELSAGSGVKVWWKCKECSNVWMSSIANRVGGRGCPQCAKKNRAKEKNTTLLLRKGSLKNNNPELIEEWDYTKNEQIGMNPNSVLSGSHRHAYWICKKCENNWKASIASRAINGNGCPECGKKISVDRRMKNVIFNRGSLEDNNSEILQEWDYAKNVILPTEVTSGSARLVWWICKKCGNNWQSRVDHRVKGIGCPQCARESSSSFPEQAVYYFLKQYNQDAINGDRNIIKPYELDIFIPSKNYAIEYDCILR